MHFVLLYQTKLHEEVVLAYPDCYSVIRQCFQVGQRRGTLGHSVQVIYGCSQPSSVNIILSVKDIFMMGSWHVMKMQLNEYVHNYLSKFVNDGLSIKPHAPLLSAISASSVSVATCWTPSLAEHPELLSLWKCCESTSCDIAKLESCSHVVLSEQLMNVDLDTGLVGLSISTSLGVLTSFLGLLLRQRMSFGFDESAATQVALAGCRPGELGLLDFWPLENCVSAKLFLSLVLSDCSSSPAEPQSISCWDDGTSCVLPVCAQSFEMSRVLAPQRSSSFLSIKFVFGTPSFRSSGLMSAVKLDEKKKETNSWSCVKSLSN